MSTFDEKHKNEARAQDHTTSMETATNSQRIEHLKKALYRQLASVKRNRNKLCEEITKYKECQQYQERLEIHKGIFVTQANMLIHLKDVKNTLQNIFNIDSKADVNTRRVQKVVQDVDDLAIDLACLVEENPWKDTFLIVVCK